METKYTLTLCRPLGDNDPKYGQTYWAEAQESKVPLMFNSTSEVHVGDKISFESMAPKKSQSGNDYMRLKKVRVVGQASKEAKPTQGSTDILKLLMDNNRMLRALTGEVSEVEKAVSADHEPTEEEVDERPNLDDIPF